MSSNLAVKLREGTKKAHTMAENVGFVKCFLRGVVEKTSYRKLVANLYFVYEAMEAEMERHRNHPIVSQIYFPELNRKTSLEQDLYYYSIFKFFAGEYSSHDGIRVSALG